MRIFRHKTVFLIVLTLLYFSVITFASTRRQIKTQKPKKTEARVKNTADYGKYNFTFRTLGGKTIHLSDYAGKVVLVNIWGPWCSPCKMETPGFVRLYDKFHAKGFDILGVAIQTSESDVRSFMGKYKVRWQIGIKDEIAKAYNTIGIPQSYLFNRDGSLIKEFVGYASDEVIESMIQDALKPAKKK